MKTPTIVLLALSVPLAGLSFASAMASVDSAETAIAAITAQSKVTYSIPTRAAIDSAIAAVDALDPNLNLQDKVANYSELTDAKVEYVRLAIKTADQADRRKLADGISDDEVARLISDAREAVDELLSEDEIALVPNYGDLLALEADEAYSAFLNAAAQESAPVAETTSATGETTKVELC